MWSNKNLNFRETRPDVRLATHAPPSQLVRKVFSCHRSINSQRFITQKNHFALLSKFFHLQMFSNPRIASHWAFQYWPQPQVRLQMSSFYMPCHIYGEQSCVFSCWECYFLNVYSWVLPGRNSESQTEIFSIFCILPRHAELENKLQSQDFACISINTCILVCIMIFLEFSLFQIQIEN